MDFRKEAITGLFTPKPKPADEVNTVYLGEIDEESLIVDLNELTEDLLRTFLALVHGKSESLRRRASLLQRRLPAHGCH